MNNDLISREALKEDLFIKFGNQLPNGLFDEIDNAPTVELFCSYLSDGEVRQPCVESPCEHERPQGEWIKAQGEWVTDTVYKICFKCSECDGHFGYPFNFCPNCGARMGGTT